MIAPLLSISGPDGQEPLRRNLLGLVAEAVLTGVGFALTVPLLRALFDGDLRLAWIWLAVMVALLAIYAVLRYRTQLAGYKAAIALADSLFARLGQHIAQLPLGLVRGGACGPDRPPDKSRGDRRYRRSRASLTGVSHRAGNSDHRHSFDVHLRLAVGTRRADHRAGCGPSLSLDRRSDRTVRSPRA